jgi:hypothetical protein
VDADGRSLVSAATSVSCARSTRASRTRARMLCALVAHGARAFARAIPSRTLRLSSRCQRRSNTPGSWRRIPECAP